MGDKRASSASVGSTHPSLFTDNNRQPLSHTFIIQVTPRQIKASAGGREKLQGFDQDLNIFVAGCETVVVTIR